MSNSFVPKGVTPAGSRILRLLVGRLPKTISEIAQELNLTRTAITTQLDELIGNGFIIQQLEHCHGPGRPKYRFSATEKAGSQFSENAVQFLVPATFSAVRKHTSPETFIQICRDIAADLAVLHSGPITATDIPGRLRQFAETQNQNGQIVEIKESNDGIELWKYACPFAAMMDKERVVCQLTRTALQIAVGSGVIVEQIQHRLDGSPCCVFRMTIPPPVEPEP